MIPINRNSSINTSMTTLLAGVCVMICSACAMAYDPAATASVNQDRVKANESFSLVIKAQGRDVEEPEIPRIRGAEVDPDPVSHQSSWQFSYTGGRMVKGWKHEWIYRGRATHEGPITIPRIIVPIDGRNYLTNEVTLNTGQASPVTAIPAVNRSTSGSPAQHLSRNQPPGIDDILFIESEVDRPRVYQGEAVMLTLRIYELNMPGARISFDGGRSIPLPDTEGFYSGPIHQKQTIEKIDGWDYRVNVIRKPLFPTGVGAFTISEWAWNGSVQGRTRFGTERKRISLTTDPITVEVRPLPPRPDDFSGAVGRFRISASLLKGEAVQAEPVPLQVRISGRGNPDAISAPRLPEIPWAMVSEPESETRHENEEDWTEIEKIFTWNITPHKTGDLTIPPITWCYFAPMLGNYKTDSTGPLQVHVAPSPEGNRMVVVGGLQQADQNRVDIIEGNVASIIRSAPGLAPARSGMFFNIIPILFAPLAWAAFAFYMRRRRRLQEDTAYARGYYALINARKRLEEARGAENPGTELYHALTTWLADRFNISDAGITSADARRLLEEKKAGDAAGAFIRVLRACERKEYSGSSLNAREAGALIDAASSAIEELDPVLRKGGES